MKKKAAAVHAFLLAIVAAPLACLAVVWLAGVPEQSQLLARCVGIFLFEWLAFFILFSHFSDDDEEGTLEESQQVPSPSR